MKSKSFKQQRNAARGQKHRDKRLDTRKSYQRKKLTKPDSKRNKRTRRMMAAQINQAPRLAAGMRLLSSLSVGGGRSPVKK